MATFSTRFLGCKVSFADAQAIRERLLADGHTEVGEGGEIQVVNTLLRHPRGRLEVAAGRRARGPHGAHGLRDGLRVEARGRLREGSATTSSSTERTGDEAAAFVARDVGAIGCVDAEHRLDRCARS